jgi:uncharacterized protein
VKPDKGTNLRSILDLLLPREVSFFNHMSAQAENFCLGCEEFKRFFSEIDNVSEDEIHRMVKSIKDIELKGDEIERSIIYELDTTFITPLDREDIHSIVTGVDTSLDILNDTAQKIEIYGIREVPANMVKYSELIVDTSLEPKKLVDSLQKRKGSDIIVRRIHKFENDADFLFHTSMAELFNTKDSIRILKFKDMYQNLEDVINSVDHIAKTIRGVIVKQG